MRFVTLASAALLALLGFSSAVSFAQTLRLRTQAPVIPVAKPESPWSAQLSYAALTDYADTRTPRSYNNSVSAALSYKLDPRWSASVSAAGVAESVDGQVSKGREQTYEETLNLSTSMDLTYDGSFTKNHKYGLFIYGSPLWDEPSRLEGYQGLVGAGGNISLRFFGKAWTINNVLSASELINSYYYGSDLSPNPDYSFRYRLVNSFLLPYGFKFAVSFGVKSTRYLDGFWNYGYANILSLSNSWNAFTVTLSYDSGGFTDDGIVRLWYLDEYRRIGRFTVSYAF